MVRLIKERKIILIKPQQAVLENRIMAVQTQPQTLENSSVEQLEVKGENVTKLANDRDYSGLVKESKDASSSLAELPESEDRQSEPDDRRIAKKVDEITINYNTNDKMLMIVE